VCMVGAEWDTGTSSSGTELGLLKSNYWNATIGDRVGGPWCGTPPAAEASGI
jgi:hypothetical protein